MWKEDIIKLQNFSISPQEIYTIVKVNFDPQSWLVSAIYASPDLNMRIMLWDKLYHISTTFKGD